MNADLYKIAFADKENAINILEPQHSIDISYKQYVILAIYTITFFKINRLCNSSFGSQSDRSEIFDSNSISTIVKILFLFY